MPKIKIVSKKRLPKALAGMGVLAPQYLPQLDNNPLAGWSISNYITTTTTAAPSPGVSVGSTLFPNRSLFSFPREGLYKSLDGVNQKPIDFQSTLKSPLDKINPFDKLSMTGGYKKIQTPANKQGIIGINYPNVANGPQGGIGITNVNFKNNKGLNTVDQTEKTGMQKFSEGFDKFSTGLHKVTQGIDNFATMAGAVLNYFDQNRKQKEFNKWMGESMLPHNYYAVDTHTNRGDYDINEGMYDPYRMGYKSKGTQANPIGAMSTFVKYGGLIKAAAGITVPGNEIIQDAFLPDVSTDVQGPIPKAETSQKPFVPSTTISEATRKSGANPMAIKTFDDISNQFKGITNLGIWGDERHKKTNSDHNFGNALDIGIKDLTQGAQISEKLLKEAKERNIKYIIFDNKIWNPSISNKWRAYTGPDPHTEHVHISFNKFIDNNDEIAFTHNNPMNLHYGEFAASYGATPGERDSDGRVAKFPSLEIGIQANKDLLFGPSYNNLTISEARNKWVTGKTDTPTSSTQPIVDAMGGNRVLASLSPNERDKLFKEFSKWEGKEAYNVIKNRRIFEDGGETTNNQSTMKIRITGSPKKMRAGGQSDTDKDPKYSGQSDYGLYIGQRDLYNTMAKNQYSDAGDTVHEEEETQSNPHVLEAEGGGKGKDGETILRPDGTHMKIVGKRHSEGGVKLTKEQAPEGSFIYSDTQKMKIKDKNILSHFNKGSVKGGITPAQIAKQYDVNKYLGILQDPNSDNLSKKTAKLMVENYQRKLAELALVQEGIKGFPQGIPDVAKSIVEAATGPMQGMAPSQPQAKYGGSLSKFVGGGDNKPWLKFLTGYERNRGKAGMQPHINYGINTDKAGNPVQLDESGRPIGNPVYIAKGQEDAMDYYGKTYIPKKMPWLNELPEPLQEAAGMFGINHAQDPRIGLMQAAGIIDPYTFGNTRGDYYDGTTSANMTDKINQLWNSGGKEAVIAQFNNDPKNFLGAYTQTLTSPTEIDKTGLKGIYANTNQGSNLAGWTDRVNQTNQDILNRYYNEGVAPTFDEAVSQTQPTVQQTASASTQSNLPTYNTYGTKFKHKGDYRKYLDWNDPIEGIWSKGRYDKEWKPAVKSTMEDPQKAKFVEEYLKNYPGPNKPLINKLLKQAEKTGDVNKAIQDLATDYKVGPFHNAVKEAIEYMKKIPSIEPQKLPVSVKTPTEVVTTDTTTEAPDVIPDKIAVPGGSPISSRLGRARWTSQDIRNAANAGWDYATLKKYHPYTPTIQPVLPEFTPTDWRGYAATLQSAANKTGEELGTYQPGQSYAANRSFLAGQQAGQLADYISKVDQYNAAGATNMDVQRAQTLNQFALQNAADRAKNFGEENIYDALYREAERNARKGIVKTINQGEDTASKIYNFNQTSPYFKINPYTQQISFKDDNAKAAYEAAIRGGAPGDTDEALFNRIERARKSAAFAGYNDLSKQMADIRSFLGYGSSTPRDKTVVTTPSMYPQQGKTVSTTYDDDNQTTDTTTSKYGGGVGASYVKSVSDWYNKLGHIEDPNERQRLAEAYASKMHFGK